VLFVHSSWNLAASAGISKDQQHYCVLKWRHNGINCFRQTNRTDRRWITAREPTTITRHTLYQHRNHLWLAHIAKLDASISVTQRGNRSTFPKPETPTARARPARSTLPTRSPSTRPERLRSSLRVCGFLSQSVG